MKTTIAPFDPESRTVAVTFASGDLVHERTVNACLAEDGSYDAEATAERVADVARGVAIKMRLGVIGPAEELPDPEPLPEPRDTALQDFQVVGEGDIAVLRHARRSEKP